MAEEGPKIEIAGAHEDISSIRRKAEATKVSPYGPIKKEEEPKKEPEILSETAKTAAGILAGAAAATAAEEIGEGIAGAIKEAVKKEKETPPKEEGLHERVGYKESRFNKIQEQLRSLINNPDPNKEQQLKFERARLVNDAVEAGVLRSLKGVMHEIQANNDFGEARKKIAEINIPSIELTAAGARDWNKDFSGMLDEYRDVAVLHMDLAEKRAQGLSEDNEEVKKLKREIEIRGWGNPPQGLEGMARAAGEKPPTSMEDFLLRMQSEERTGMAPSPPPDVVALFKQGRLGIYEKYWQGRVEFLDVTKPEDRRKWIALNMAVFNNGTIPSPELSWKRLIDYWVTDLKDAARFANLDKASLKETEEDILAMMSVSASARAMEVSGGNPIKYGAVLTGGREEPDLDKQDEWGPFLLHNDSAKLNRLIGRYSEGEKKGQHRFPFVAHFYHRLLKDAGIEVKREWERDIPSRIGLKDNNSTQAIGGKVSEYLENKAEKGGLDGYVEFVLSNEGADKLTKRARESGMSELELWSAAKTAADILLTDKFTRWEYLCDMEGRLKLFPSDNWGGDPLRSLLDPTFLPRAIKKVFPDSNILNLVDYAFHPLDIFVDKSEEKLKDKELTPSMVTHFKAYMRLSKALGLVLGNSQAESLPLWTDKELAALNEVASNINQVYGAVQPEAERNRMRTRKVLGGKEEKFKDYYTGRHITGSMMARIIYAKAQALAEQFGRPGIRENLRRFFGPVEEDPFDKIIRTLWGEHRDGKSGFLFEKAGPGMRFVLDGTNKYDAKLFLEEAKRIFTSGSKEYQDAVEAELFEAAGLAGKIAKSAAETYGKR